MARLSKTSLLWIGIPVAGVIAYGILWPDPVEPDAPNGEYTVINLTSKKVEERKRRGQHKRNWEMHYWVHIENKASGVQTVRVDTSYDYKSFAMGGLACVKDGKLRANACTD